MKILVVKLAGLGLNLKALKSFFLSSVLTTEIFFTGEIEKFSSKKLKMLQSKVFNKKTRGGRIQKVSLQSLYASSSSSFRVFLFVIVTFNSLSATASKRGLSTR